MKEGERMDKPLRDLLEIIHFTENVSAKIHGVLDEAKIYSTVNKEFGNSKKYNASILLLTDDGTKLRIAETSLTSSKLRAGEKASGLRLKGYRIELDKSSIYNQVVWGGKTVQVNSSDIISELVPRPLAHIVSKITGYKNKPVILTPLKRHEKIVGVLAVSSTSLGEQFVPSVKSFAKHISNTLELVARERERKEIEEAHACQRKQMEETLTKNEQRLRNIIDTSPDAIVWTDTAGKVTLVNRKGFELTGFSKKELIGNNFMDVKALTQESKERILESFMKRIQGIDTPPYEVEVVAKNGEIIPTELSASAIYEGDEIVGTQSIFRDLRERKRAEEALKESEAKFRNLAEQSPNMIFINKKGRVVYANKKCEEIMGYEREEFYSPDFSFLTLISPESVDLVKSKFRRHMKGEDVAPYEYRLVTKEGKIIEAIITPKLIAYEGEQAILGIITDITERKKAEEAVKHYSERLEELVEERTAELKKAQERLLKSERLAAIGELATMVGHDLRNPLQSIENATYYLNNELPQLLSSTSIPQRAIEMLQVINNSVNYADKIIRDLQDFSATKKPRLKKININALVKDTLSRVEAPKNVEPITQLGQLPEIEGDPDMIHRIFLNLASNGVQAMKGKGGRLKILTKETKGFVEVSFKDTGVGIPEKNMKKLFTPFFTTKAKGMGMGLAICKRLVESHGGSIEVKSVEGKGSTFTVKLPIQQENGGDNT